MSYILHLGHQPSDIGVDASTIVTTTGAGYFDETLDVNCVRLDTEIAASNPSSLTFNWTAAVSDTTWIGFRARRIAGSLANSLDYLTFSNSQDGTLVQVKTSNYKTQIIVYGDTTETITTSYEWSAAYTQWHDIKITVNANISCEFYVDGVSIGLATAANTGNKSNPTNCFLDAYQGANGINSDEFYFAHLAVLDNVPTVGRRFIRQTPTAAGTHTDFVGNVSALADGSVSTGMTSDTAGQRQSFTLTGPTIPTGPISSVTVVQTSSHVGSGPGKSAGFIKVGGTNYDGTAETVTETPSQIITTFETNPADSNPWDDTTLPSEYGIVTST